MSTAIATASAKVHADDRPSGAARRWRVWVCAAVLVLGGLAAWSNSFQGRFFEYDDVDSIRDNPQIRRLWPLRDAFSMGLWGTGATVDARPVLSFSFALNHAASGLEPWSYHAANLAIHLAAGLTLLGVLRRTLRVVGVDGPDGARATWLAGAIALLWTLHPLQTESVTYTVQRAESLMGLWYLLTLYASIRAFTAPARRLPWYAAAVACFLLGVGTKEVIASAPVLVFLYDALFVSHSFRTALRRRWAFYLALAGGWILQGFLVFTWVWGDQGVDPLPYLLTQPGVLLQYVRLTFWPYGLVFDYQPELVKDIREALFPSLVVAGGLLVTLWGLARKRWYGFAGAWFFLILAPSSSFIPTMNPMNEHRMYLPLAAVLAMAVLGGDWVLRRLPLHPRAAMAGGALLVLAAAALLGVRTYQRNRVWQTPLSYWTDNLAKDTDNFPATMNLGVAYARRGELRGAVRQFSKALEMAPGHPQVLQNLANAYAQMGRRATAIRHYRAALARGLDTPRLHYNLGETLALAHRTPEAIAHLRRSVALDPDYVNSLELLAWLLATAGDPGLADGPAAVALAQRARDLTHGQDPGVLDTLAAAHAQSGRFDLALAACRQALAVLGPEPPDTPLLQGLRRHIALYEAHQPCRELPRISVSTAAAPPPMRD